MCDAWSTALWAFSVFIHVYAPLIMLCRDVPPSMKKAQEQKQREAEAERVRLASEVLVRSSVSVSVCPFAQHSWPICQRARQKEAEQLRLREEQNELAARAAQEALDSARAEKVHQALRASCLSSSTQQDADTAARILAALYHPSATLNCLSRPLPSPSLRLLYRRRAKDAEPRPQRAAKRAAVWVQPQSLTRARLQSHPLCPPPPSLV